MWALERAKQNVLENYLLVGILEELEDVLLLLERLLPHYFTGVLSIYKSPGMWAAGFWGEAQFQTVVLQGGQFVLMCFTVKARLRVFPDKGKEKKNISNTVLFKHYNDVVSF